MRFILLGTALCTTIFMPHALAQEGDNKTRKIELAQQYSEIIPFDKEVEKSIEQIAMQVPVAQRTQFRTILQQNINANQLETASETALIDIFTEAELEAMIEFYGTPEGKSIMEKMPEYQSRLQPVLQAMVQEAALSLSKQMSGN